MEFSEKDNEKKKKFESYKKKFLVLFYFLMALLLIYLFHPFSENVIINKEEKIFIFILGLLMIIDIIRRHYELIISLLHNLF